MSHQPEELLYAETHEWVHLDEADGSKVATIGISAFAVEQLSDLVHIELKETGSQVETGGEIGEVESVKAVSSIYAPVAGEIIAVNDQLADALELFQDDPYGQGWIVKIKVSDDAGLGSLLDHSAYQKQCEE